VAPQRPSRSDHLDTPPAADPRSALLSGVPVAERTVRCAGVSTAVLEGGDGPPLILLHGPGESAVNWRWCIPELTTTHRVIAPDLPAHGSSDRGSRPLDEDLALDWLDELIDATCPPPAAPPVLVGHVLGGAIAARFAAARGDRLGHLVLVDSLGLARFRPSRRFLTAFVRFVARPSEATYTRFMDQCAYDLDALRTEMAGDWTAFVAYNLALARSPEAKAAGGLFRRVGIPRIPEATLSRIRVPTTLIWGRHDRALRLRIAERASERFGWPLHVIEDAADDPPRDQPEAFLRTLRRVLDPS
jgi:pimeloyl-ACP methyl ester carboxylesterase